MKKREIAHVYDYIQTDVKALMSIEKLLFSDNKREKMDSIKCLSEIPCFDNQDMKKAFFSLLLIEAQKIN